MIETALSILAEDLKSSTVSESRRHEPRSTLATRQAANLVELSELIRGLLTDEEVDNLFLRNPSVAPSI